MPEERERRRPTCRKCGSPVPEFSVGRSLTNGRVFFESKCHGETDRYEYWPANVNLPRFLPVQAFPHDLPPPEAISITPPSMPRTVLTIQDELFALPEWKRVRRVLHFDMSVRLFERNAAELLAALDALTRDPRTFHLVQVSDRAALDAVLEQVVYLLHNFVAAALTLVDHTRVLHQDLYADSELFPDYQDEVSKRFATVPLIQFVKCLRQFAQHVRLPHVSFNVSIERGAAPVRKILLAKADLMESSLWSAQAKKYLATAADLIDLEEVVRGYGDAVRDFYSWMKQRQTEIHKQDLEAVEKKQKEGVELLAQDMPRLLEIGLSILVDHGVGDITAIFAPLLAPADWVELGKLHGDPGAWAGAALAIVEKRFGKVPPDLDGRIRAVATQLRPAAG